MTPPPRFRSVRTSPPVERDIRASSAEQFLLLLSPIASGWNNAPRDWIFRGVGDAEKFTLVPSALRMPPPVLKYTNKSLLDPRTHSQQVEAEYDLLWDFFRVADAQGLLIPEDSQIYRSPWASTPIHRGVVAAKAGDGPWPFDELMSLVALAQHHGVPTRLMDWSNDAFIAAYFGAADAAIRLEHGESSDSLLAVWCLNWRYVWKRWPGKKPDDIEVLLVMAPRATNPNLHAQGGLFTVHIVKPGKSSAPINRDPLDLVIEKRRGSIAIKAPVMRQITLPIRESGRLLRLLAAHNIHAASIFPGFDGVVKYLKEWRRWDEPPPSGDLPIH